MKANYNEWFYKYNQYIATKDQGVMKDYNDTSWVNIMTRIKQLESVGNALVTQPFGVAGTERGFAHLLDLMVKSNYSFNDIDDSLMESYKKTLQASMSNMMVNSHAIILSCKSNDKRYVTYDQQSRYHLITVPFDQLHFGDRDEFIRQKLPLMHTKANKKFIPLQEFVSKEIDQILGFTLVVSVNGYICNDCMFAIDEQGFQFKVMWTDGFSDNGKDYLEFIIYKLDTFKTYMVDSKTSPTPFANLKNYIINGWTLPLKYLNIDKSDFMNGERGKCLIDIYFPQYLRNGRSAPVFGILDRDGLHVETYGKAGVDINKTFDTASECVLIIYELKYLHEIPNIYPATNYMDMIDDRRVYTERKDGVVDYNDFRIVSEANFDSRSIPICTPPIAIDRDSSSHFQILTRCLDIEPALRRLSETIVEVGNTVMYRTHSQSEVETSYRELVAIPLLNVVNAMTTEYAAYLQGALLTSRIPRRGINVFRDTIEELTAFANDTANNIPNHLTKMNIYTQAEYDKFINIIIKPFKEEDISIFKDIVQVKPANWYKSKKTPALNDNETPHRFTRPVSEQCFITLKWNYNKSCWLFAAPTISHFKGIGNTFYIDQGLNGNEVFKFFVLYTDTDEPTGTEVDPLSLEQVYDFDKFYDEVSKHEGYIKYWNAENKLMKLSKILYNKYDDETVVQVLSKILQGSVEADDILNVYGSELKYDYPGKSSLTYDPKTDRSIYDPLTDDAAPFTINYLFYTMMMIHDNVDNIEALFMRMLVDNKYRRRYIDVNISDAIDKSITLPMNYSRYSIAPIQINSGTSHIDLGVKLFYGVPLLINNRASSLPNPYRFTFNKYEENRQYPLLSADGIDREYYLLWEDLSLVGASEVTLAHDIQVAKLAAKYLTYVYTCINNIETNYVKAYDCRSLIDAFKTSYDLIKNELFDIQAQYTLQQETSECLNEIISDENPFIERIDDIYGRLRLINQISFENRSMDIHTFINKFIKLLRTVYIRTGYNGDSLRRIQKLYGYLNRYNKIMNIHELKKWWNDLDTTQIQMLSQEIASYNNPPYKESASTFISYYDGFIDYIQWKVPVINSLDDTFYENTVDELRALHFNSIASFVSYAFEHFIYDMYSIDNIVCDQNTIYNTRPYYASATISSDHFNPPLDSSTPTDKVLLFYIDSIKNGNGWSINSMTPITDYCCFDDTPIDSLSITIYNISGTSLGTSTVDISFKKVGSSAGSDKNINMIPNVSITPIMFDNDHENITIDQDTVISSVCNEMNYEMLFGNKYLQLNHDTEYVLDPVTYEEHVQQIVRIPNKLINSIILSDNVGKSNAKMYFKPAQILHLPIDEYGMIESVYGKCFVGQTIYLSTDDGLSVFPAKVTVIDHSVAHGFIEAEVDSYNAKWFSTTDPEVISKYLTSTVECHVIDDNIANFYKEYSNTEYMNRYNINDPQIGYDSSDSLLGDPLYVMTNSQYVYDRLNYFFHEDIPNRFIDDEKATWKFIYLGEAIGKYGTVPPEPVPPTPGPDPTKYSRLDYIQATYGQAFTLAQSYDENTKIYFDIDLYGALDYLPLDLFERPYTSDMTAYTALCGADTNDNTKRVYVHLGWFQPYYRNKWANMPFQAIYGNKSSVGTGQSMWEDVASEFTPPKASNRRIIKMDSTHFRGLYYDEREYIDDDTYQHNYFDLFKNISGAVLPTGDIPLGIFAVNNGNGEFSKFTSGKLYGLKVYDGETLIQDLVPCIDDLTSKSGMYDLVRNEFYPSETELDFVPGDIIEWSDNNNSESTPVSDDPTETQTNPIIKIDLINRSIHDVDDSELYPILRDEPNDHYVWEKELEVFRNTINTVLKPQIDECNATIEGLKRALPHVPPGWEREQIIRRIESYNNKIDRLKDRIKQIEHYGVQQECETTWQNVQSYDATLVYMNNGRAETLPRLIIDKRDITMSQEMKVYLYDWTNKKWITPNTYTVSYDIVTTSIDAKADYSTHNIVKRMKIEPIIPSDWDNIKDILVYIAFNASDVYDELSLNANSCQVQFKPIISTAKPQETDPDVYDSIRLRKHFDGKEVYHFTSFDASDHEFEGNGFYVKRVPINGKDIDNPVLRVCDMTLTNPSESTFVGNQLQLYVKMPFGTTQPVVPYITPTYSAQIHLEIDNFIPDEQIKLIAISNNNQSQYNGTISSVMFEALTGYDEENDRKFITITKSTLPDYVSGDYMCTVFRSNDYQSYGGLITVHITPNEDPIMTDNGRWVKIPSEGSDYKELPREFIIVPPLSDEYNPDDVTLTIENNYKTHVTLTNPELNPLQFYYNAEQHIRYPFSDVKSNDHTHRLHIDTSVTVNPDIDVAKMTYLGIARYSLLSIPSDGFIDVTGFVPTPLSRDRYEWWVNGRQVEDDNIIILSPTSFQLKNLRSLKNFELIELVDDVNDNELMVQGNVYTDINGNTYGSYHLALESNKLIVDQSVRYLFNTSNHTKMNDYTRSISDKPNNLDIESDILETINTREPDPEEDPEVVKYNELFNRPTINGVPIYNMRSTDLGLIEIPTDQLQELYDEVWKKEIMTNPLFCTSHKRSLQNNDVLTLHSQSGDSFGYPDSIIVYASGIVDKSFTLYISHTEDGKITNIANTIKIMPYVRTGVYVVIDKKYKNEWLHCTEPNTKSIQI